MPPLHVVNLSYYLNLFLIKNWISSLKSLFSLHWLVHANEWSTFLSSDGFLYLHECQILKHLYVHTYSLRKLWLDSGRRVVFISIYIGRDSRWFRIYWGALCCIYHQCSPSFSISSSWISFSAEKVNQWVTTYYNTIKVNISHKDRLVHVSMI